MELTAAECRVLGVLVEKHMTTPDHYPLSTSALIAACNQTSNRNPVVDYDEAIAIEAVDGLRAKGLARTVKRAGERAIKHLETIEEGLDITRAQKPLLAVLLLRGPQTSGELRQRTERYMDLGSIEDIESSLDEMANADIPTVYLADRVPGQKERRWVHLVGSEDQPTGDSGAVEVPLAPAQDQPPSRLAELEAQVAALTERVARLETSLGIAESAPDEPAQ